MRAIKFTVPTGNNIKYQFKIKKGTDTSLISKLDNAIKSLDKKQTVLFILITLKSEVKNGKTKKTDKAETLRKAIETSF
jgi:hypothetical protein